MKRPTIERYIRPQIAAISGNMNKHLDVHRNLWMYNCIRLYHQNEKCLRHAVSIATPAQSTPRPPRYRNDILRRQQHPSGWRLRRNRSPRRVNLWEIGRSRREHLESHQETCSNPIPSKHTSKWHFKILWPVTHLKGQNIQKTLTQKTSMSTIEYSMSSKVLPRVATHIDTRVPAGLGYVRMTKVAHAPLAVSLA